MKRFLKKLNTLDYVFIVLLILVLTFGMVYFSKRPVSVYIHVLSFSSYSSSEPYSTQYWVGNSIKTGNEVFDSTGRMIAEVVEVDNIDFGGRLSKTLLKLKVNAVQDKRTSQYRLNDTLLKVGSFISLDIGSISFYGMITHIGNSIDPRNLVLTKKIIELKSSQIQPWLAKTYNENFIVTNTDNEEIFKIIRSEIKPAEISVETAAGGIVKAYDPILKDVFITAEIKVGCQMDVCYYNEILPVKIGLDFWTQSKNSIIEGATTKVIDFKDLEDSTSKNK